MSDTSKSFQAPRWWNTWTPYLAFLFGILILLIIIVSNKNQDTSEKSSNIRGPEHAFETTGAPAQATAQDPNAVATNGTSTSAVAQPDPFRAFLEAHKNIQPPVNAQPAPQTPQAIKEAFKAAVEKDISSAYPFAASHVQNSTDGSNKNH